MTLKSLAPAIGLMTLLSGTPALAAPMQVTCEPGQRAVVNTNIIRGETITHVQCVSTGAYRSATYRAARYRVARPHRSWAKSALIIGGSAGTGAGVGGMIHGKKGALVGAALGGGLASIYEGAHRR